MQNAVKISALKATGVGVWDKRREGLVLEKMIFR
jgi:hypothetical protein